MKEVWKPIKGFEEYYSVSNKGRVRNDIRLKLLTPGSSNYLRVSLYYGPKPKVFLVHRLVALAFIPNPLNLPEVNHMNLNRADNLVDNLEWSTRKTNSDHAWDNNAYPHGEKSHLTKLTKQKVLKIREEYIRGKVTLQSLAVKYGTGFSNISAIILRKSWRHI